MQATQSFPGVLLVLGLFSFYPPELNAQTGNLNTNEAEIGSAAGASPEPSAGPIPTAADELGSITFPHDLAFDKYCDITDFLMAVHSLDAEAAADFALELAYARSILLRDRNGFPTDKAIEVAARIAAEMNDQAALARVAKAADRVGIDELSQKIAALTRTPDGSQSADDQAAINLANTSVEQFSAIKALHDQLRRSRVLGDTEHAESIAAQADRIPLLSDSHKTEVRKTAKSVKKVGDNTRDDLFGKLSGFSRDCMNGGMDGQWQTTYTTADGSTVDALVTISGNTGTYQTSAGTSQLQIRNAAAPLGGGPTVVQGRWIFVDNETGFFNWQVSGDHFDGSWTFADNSGHGTWSGDRLANGGGGLPGDNGGDPTSNGGSGGFPTDNGGDPAGSGGFPSNNGGGFPSSNGGGFPSNNGGGLPSDNGSGSPTSGGDVSLDTLFGSYQSTAGSAMLLGAGGTQIQDPRSKMFLPGKLVRAANGDIFASTNTPRGRMLVRIEALNRNQLRVGRTGTNPGVIYTRDSSRR